MADIGKLEALNRQLGFLQTLTECVGKLVDLRELVHKLGADLELRVEAGDEPLPLFVAPELVDFALRALLGVVAENRGPRKTAELTLRVRMVGDGTKATALVSLSGRHLELEGILPEPQAEAVPNHGRIGVFIAKEILRMHQGEIHGGPGLEGAEILLAFRALDPGGRGE